MALFTGCTIETVRSSLFAFEVQTLNIIVEIIIGYIFNGVLNAVEFFFFDNVVIDVLELFF